MRPINLGPWRLELLDTGRFGLDGGAMFGSAPRALWERFLTPDEQHRIPLALRVLLLRHETGSPVVLVDTGVGDKFEDKFRHQFAIEAGAPGSQPPLLSTLRKAGTDPSEITHVLLTHLHFDHAGGVSRRRGERVVPTFPDAEHVLQRANLETAREPNPRERASYLAENIEPLRDVKLTLLDGEEELFTGVRVSPSRGHTDGMQTVRVEGGGSVLYYVADLMPTQYHVHLPITMGYDLCPREIMREKEKLLTAALDEEALIAFEHDPTTPYGHLGRERDRFTLQAGSSMGDRP